MCVHCTETWCFSCIDRVGTCGCGGLTEEGFLRPLELVEAAPPPRGTDGVLEPVGPCLSTASSCNLAACTADTAVSGGAAAAAAAEGAALTLAALRAEAHSCSGGVGAGAQQQLQHVAPSSAPVRAIATASNRNGEESDGDDDSGPQWSSNGGSCTC
jgi:hypothetical protein